MHWLKLIFPQKSAAPVPPEGLSAEEEKKWRLSILTPEEQKAFEWFQLGYTAPWTAETMLLDRRTADRLFTAVFRKLRVANASEVCRVYRMMALTPKTLAAQDPLNEIPRENRLNEMETGEFL